jgi:chromosome partitioning protein
MRTIAVLNQKGGVGKTTTVANTSAALATLGARVLVLDLDPQSHLTIHMGLEPQNLTQSSYRVLIQTSTIDQDILMVRPNLWVLPANIDLVGAESELVSVVGREIILREALETIEDRFDYCLIDCAPSLGLLTLNALAAAQEVLIPLQPHFLALQGFGKLLQTVELVNKRINPHLRVTGILLCMFDTRASLPNEVKHDIEDFLQNARGGGSAWEDAQMLPTFIRRNIKLAEAPSYGKTIFEYENDCNGAQDYRKVAEFIANMGKEEVTPEQAEEDMAVQPESIPTPVHIEVQDATKQTGQNLPDSLQQTGHSETTETAQTPVKPAPFKILEFEELHKPSRTAEPQVSKGPSVSQWSDQDRPKRIPPESNHSAW